MSIRQMGPMQGMADIAMPVAYTPWTAADFALMAIWWAMMTGHDAAFGGADDPDLRRDQSGQANARPSPLSQR